MEAAAEQSCLWSVDFQGGEGDFLAAILDVECLSRNEKSGDGDLGLVLEVLEVLEKDCLWSFLDLENGGEGDLQVALLDVEHLFCGDGDLDVALAALKTGGGVMSYNQLKSGVGDLDILVGDIIGGEILSDGSITRTSGALFWATS